MPPFPSRASPSGSSRVTTRRRRTIRRGRGDLSYERALSVADLQAATDPPEDLTERTHGGVDIRLRNEAAFGSFVDLFAIGFDFARTILDPELTPGDEAHDGDGSADQTDGGAS